MSGHEVHGSRDVALLLGAMGLNSLPYGYTLVVLPIYLSDIGFSGQVIGVVTAISSVANTIALTPFAIAADRYGRKPFVLAGFVSATVAYLLFAFTHDLTLLLLASALGGVGLAGGFTAAVWTPAWTALLAEKAEERRTGAFAWSQGIWALALTIGSALSVFPFLLRTKLSVGFGMSYEYTFLVLAMFAVVSGVVLLPVQEVRVKQARTTEAHARRSLPLRSQSQIAKFSVTIGLVGFASGLAVQLLSLWFYRVYGASDTALGPWFAVAEATSLVVVPFIPRLTGRFGSASSVLLTQGLSSILLAAMILAPTYQFAAAVFIVRNFFMNIAWPIQQSYLMGTVRPEERASSSAITYTVWGVGSSVSPLLAGYLLSGSSFISISAPLTIGGAVYLASAIAFYLFFRNIAPPEEMLVMRRGRYGVARSGLE
jgi:MFS family permease